MARRSRAAVQVDQRKRYSDRSVSFSSISAGGIERFVFSLRPCLARVCDGGVSRYSVATISLAVFSWRDNRWPGANFGKRALAQRRRRGGGAGNRRLNEDPEMHSHD